ncbi:SpoIIE family protein phosphatase [candidate division KSB1 bacterium]|nr:SpoIIE family protein phosphatase [candidate division KSB1 bacterium]
MIFWFFFSDGILEQRNEKGLFFEDQVKPLFVKLTGNTPVQIADTLVKKAIQWNEKRNILDDMTVMVIRVRT